MAAQAAAVDWGASAAPDCCADGDRQGESWLPDRLVDHPRGLTIEPVYFGECFTNARGGISTARATQYEGLLDLSLTLDFERLRVPLPGRFFLLAQHTHGRGLTEDFVGDKMVLSNIDSTRNITQVSEYWWEFGLLGSRMDSNR